jgi:DNA-binding NtrC family response regulator
MTPDKTDRSEKKAEEKTEEKKTILVMDDEFVVIDILTTFFADKNYRVISESNPENFDSVVKKEQPDLIFLDNRMSPVTGKELLRRMRMNGVGIPVVMMSAYKTRDGIFEMKQLGAIDYISKPFDFKRISKILSQCF